MTDNHFYIESIRFDGDNVDASVIRFSPGFNIIHGPSDTGKTYLAKAIKYMLAGSTAPFGKETGYDRITMVLQGVSGKVTLKRGLGSTLTYVVADRDYGIPAGEYEQAPTDGNDDHFTISDVLLRMIGLNEPRSILTNRYGSKEKLSWRTFSKTLHRSENRITSEESIFTSAKYATLSAFLTLFYDYDLSTYREGISPADIATRKRVLVPFINDDIEKAEARRDALVNETREFEGRSVRDEIDELGTRMESLTHDQAERLSKIADLNRLISNLEHEQTRLEFAIAKYNDLASVYVAKIKRLTFDDDANDHAEYLRPEETCAFCGSKIHVNELPDYSEAIASDTANEVSNLQELQRVQEQLSSRTIAVQQHLSEAKQELAALQTDLANELTPAIKELSQAIRELRQVEEKRAEIEMLNAKIGEWGSQIGDISTEEPTELNYELEGFFPREFFSSMTKYLREILTEVHYEKAKSATFDEDDFDIVVAGKRKKSHGKGYRAFFNTIVGLALRHYISERALYKPTIMLFDTPTLGLEHQKSGDDLITRKDENGRPVTGLLRNLFDYMIDTADQGQLIILNNTDVTPPSDFDGAGAMELVFGDGDDADQPGLLHDIREQVADETNEQGSLF
ncbi:MAG: hypothetical protein PUK59_02665 [Actinomycetaceae bacterium]|nr:hypothetical protein [Actinomycetaceae bacterium]MDY5273990.1 hypothetical protein [Arcanobacterium sp.]